MQRMLIGCALVFGLSASTTAQQPALEGPAHKVFVMTGCIAARPDAPAVFTLSDTAAIGEAPESPAPVAVGTSGKKVDYELVAVTGVSAQGLKAEELKAHAGQRVEVMVRPIEVVAASAPAGTTSAVNAEKAAQPEPMRFTVTQIKRTSGACQ